LEEILTRQTVLFPGGSLASDYTFNHWIKTIEDKGSGVEHFAITSCAESERRAKRRDLSNSNILSILYDENNHDAVRVILNQLYKDTDGGEPENNLPPQNKYFSGRADQLESINTLFMKNENNAVNICQTVSGLGGVGKTQLAVEYAYRYYDNFKNGIWFVNAETSITTQNYFTDFTKAFNIDLPPEFTPEELQGAIKAWLSDNNEWLLIFDNLESADTITPYLPAMINGKIVITTRNGFGTEFLGFFG